MATKPKKWPHQADWARCDCIALAAQGRRDLLGVLDQVSSPVVLRAITKAVESFREIESRLHQVGAQAEKEKEL